MEIEMNDLDSFEFIVNADNFSNRNSNNDEIDRYNLDKQKSIRYGQDTKERKLLSHWVMVVVSVWLLLVLATIILNIPLCLKIDKTVSCMLLGTTTINILGLAYIVLKGLFDVEKVDFKK